MTGKKMCRCEMKDVKEGKQKKICKKCNIYSCRNTMVTVAFLVLSTISMFYFKSFCAGFPIIWIGMACVYYQGYGQYDTFQSNYFNDHEKTNCEYCFLKPRRAIAKHFIRTFVWITPISNFLIKCIR
jgi:hypothetical protein